MGWGRGKQAHGTPQPTLINITIKVILIYICWCGEGGEDEMGRAGKEIYLCLYALDYTYGVYIVYSLHSLCFIMQRA